MYAQIAKHVNKATGLVPVQFLDSYTPYRQGEIAGFAPDQAHDLINRGMATLYDVHSGVPTSLYEENGTPKPTVIPGPDHVTIPTDWSSLPRPEIIQLAKSIVGVEDIQLTMAQARETIEAELKRREANHG